MKDENLNYGDKEIIDTGYSSVNFRMENISVLYKILMFPIPNLSLQAFSPLTMIRMH